MNNSKVNPKNKEESTTYSMNILKQVIPLMNKYNIPITPTNYAVWYTYIENSNSKLTSEIDSLINDKGICTPKICEHLHTKYLASKVEQETITLRRSLEKMLIEVLSSFDDTIKDASSFNVMLDKNFDKLNKVETEGFTIEETIGLVRSIVKSSQEIKKTTNLFESELQNAQSEIANLKSKLDELNNVATHDTLTELFNRHAFNEDLKHQINLNQKFALVILDLDHFKGINDKYGHVVGDAVLKGVSKILQQRINPIGQVYRYGGEELALILPNKTLGVACKISELCRTQIEKLKIKASKSQTYVDNITASFGVAIFENETTIEEMIEKADKFLYQAKKLGRNRVMPMII